MSARRARLVVWLAALLLVPLPYLALPVAGSVPVVRLLLLSGIAGAYSALVDGSGVAWTLVALIFGHALVYALALGLGAVLLVRWIPERTRGRLVWGLVAAGFAVACLLPVYHTPFDAVSAWTRWPGLFR